MDYFFKPVLQHLAENKTSDLQSVLQKEAELMKIRSESEQEAKEEQARTKDEWRKRELILRKQYETKIVTLENQIKALEKELRETKESSQKEITSMKQLVLSKDRHIKLLQEETSPIIKHNPNEVDWRPLFLGSNDKQIVRKEMAMAEPMLIEVSHHHHFRSNIRVCNLLLDENSLCTIEKQRQRCESS